MSETKCDECRGTGICGDEGPGLRNALHEWQPCDCPMGDVHRAAPSPEKRIRALEADLATLQARLIERTEQSTATAYRDAERIRVLEEEKKHWQEGRKEGRNEALEILLSLSADDALDDYIGNRPLADTGDYISYWKVDELRELFDADSFCSVNERLSEAHSTTEAELWCVEDRIKSLEEALRRALAIMEHESEFQGNSGFCPHRDLAEKMARLALKSKEAQP